MHLRLPEHKTSKLNKNGRSEQTIGKKKKKSSNNASRMHRSGWQTMDNAVNKSIGHLQRLTSSCDFGRIRHETRKRDLIQCSQSITQRSPLARGVDGW